jgi:hypothetical protein
VAERAPERGTGLLGTALGVAMVVAMIGLATHVAVGLWSRATVEAAATAAAHRLARTPPAERAAAVESVFAETRRRLGGLGPRTALQVRSLGPDSISIHVRTSGARLLPRLITDRSGVGAVDRTVVVRAERRTP